MQKKLTFDFLHIADAAAVKVAVMSRKGILFSYKFLLTTQNCLRVE